MFDTPNIKTRLWYNFDYTREHLNTLLTDITEHKESTSAHGISDTSNLETQAGAQSKVDTHESKTNPHSDSASLTAFNSHVSDFNIHADRHIGGGADQLDIKDLADSKNNLKGIYYYNTVNDLKTSNNLQVGNYAKTLGYYSKFDGGGALYKIVASGTGTDDGGSYHDLTNLNLQAELIYHEYIRVAWFGVKYDNSYNLDYAKHNFYALQNAMDFSSKLILDGLGVLSLIGSVYFNKDNSHLIIENGCNVKGKFRTSTTDEYLNEGHMIGIVRYADRDNGDYTTTTVNNVRVDCYGTLETIYDDFGGSITGDNRHNNNCIGIYDTDGVEIHNAEILGSDHRGLCFDGNCYNCLIKGGSIKGTYDEGIVMRGNHNNIKDIRIEKDSKVGRVDSIGIRSDNSYLNNVKIEYTTRPDDGSVVGVYVSPGNFIEVRNSKFENCFQGIRSYEVKNIKLINNEFNNTNRSIVLAGTTLLNQIKLEMYENKITSNGEVVVYNAMTADSPLKAILKNNDLTNDNTQLYFWFGNSLTNRELTLIDNEVYIDFSDSVDVINYYSNSENPSITSGTSITLDYKLVKNYKKLTFLIDVGGVYHNVVADTYALRLSSNAMNYTYASTKYLTIQKNKPNIDISVDSADSIILVTAT